MARDCARSNPARHRLVESPDDADLVVFTDLQDAGERRFAGLRGHPLVRRRPHDCFVVYHWEEPYGFLPGVYTDPPDVPWALPGLYWADRHFNPLVIGGARAKPAAERSLLASFVGRTSCHPLRTSLLRALEGAEGVLLEGTDDYDQWRPNLASAEGHRRRYVEVAGDSLFGLCPRGLRRPSIRLFEMMMLGICPVVISDGYRFPVGPDWDSFVIRVAERDIASVPGLLRERRAEAEERGRLAREAWEEHFSPERRFGWLVDQLVALRERGLGPWRRRRWAWGRRIVAVEVSKAARRLARKLTPSDPAR